MKRWRKNKNHPNYKFSSFGELKNIKKNTILNPCIGKSGYYQVNLNGKTEYIHRLIAETFIPKIEGMPIVDHIDRNPLNNHVSNLRWNTISGNALNTGLYKRNTSGHKNISWDKKREKWYVRISINKKETHKGRFETIEDAIKKRDEVYTELKRVMVF